jgi:hypothetical protein
MLHFYVRGKHFAWRKGGGDDGGPTSLPSVVRQKRRKKPAGQTSSSEQGVSPVLVHFDNMTKLMFRAG